jgi:hypothetical protein
MLHAGLSGTVQGIGDSGHFGGNSNLEFHPDTNTLTVNPAPVEYDPERLAKVMKAREDAARPFEVNLKDAFVGTHPQIVDVPHPPTSITIQAAETCAGTIEACQRIYLEKHPEARTANSDDLQQLRDTMKAMQAAQAQITAQLAALQSRLDKMAAPMNNQLAQ